MSMLTQTTLFPLEFPPPNTSITPKDFKVVALRECAPAAVLCSEPQHAYDYWQQAVRTHPFYNPDVECLVAVFLNTRKRIIGHSLISTGTLDTVLVHAREVFRTAIVAAAASIMLMHNHPSGDPSPSEADIKVTRDLIRAGQTLKIELVDHVIVGLPSPERFRPYASLRELNYFYS
jgi:DNA repair protein RadC